MTATPYKAISFSPGEILTRTKLNQMTNNEQWLFENRIQGNYSAHGLKRTSGLKLASGVTTFATTTAGGRAVDVMFGSFFSVGCNPVVVANPCGHGTGRMYCVTTGPGSGTNFPNHVGFRIWMGIDTGVTISLQRIYATVYANWIALGW